MTFFQYLLEFASLFYKFFANIHAHYSISDLK